MQKRKAHLSLYLMKPGTKIEETISDLSKVNRHDLSEDSSTGALFLKYKSGDTPWWIDFLDPLSKDDIKALSSRTTSAVLVLSVERSQQESRTVCFTFGHGRHILDTRKIERGFGLKVALNAIDSNKLRSFDTRRQNDIVINSRTQASTATSIDTFDLDTYQDIFTKVVGSTIVGQTDTLGTFVRGSDGISFDIKIDPKELARRAEEILDIYERVDYRQSFPFVDHILPVDKDLADELDELLDGELKALASNDERSFRCLYLALPEIIDFETLEGFAYSSEGKNHQQFEPELNLFRYLASRHHGTGDVGIQRAKKDRIVRKNVSEDAYKSWTIYRSLVAECLHNERLYQLANGDWYEISPSFVDEIEGFLSTIDTTETVFPTHNAQDAEKIYNHNTASQLDALLMDCQLIPLGGGRSKVELCDILQRDGTFIHCKIRSSSSTLSHLWLQGTVSMEALLNDHEFRGRAQAKIMDLDSSYDCVIGDSPKGSDFTVVYLVIGVNQNEPVWRSLPFFSQVSLVQAVRTLIPMGVGIKLAGVASS